MIPGLLLSTVSVIFDVLFWQILFLFGVLIVLSLASTIANRVWTSWHVDKDWYLAYQGMLTISHNISQHLLISHISQHLTASHNISQYLISSHNISHYLTTTHNISNKGHSLFLLILSQNVIHVKMMFISCAQGPSPF